jgi:hypothetical protein
MSCNVSRLVLFRLVGLFPGTGCGFPNRSPLEGIDFEAPGPPRVLRLQLPLPSMGQLWGRHMSYGFSSHCPAQESSGAATCPAAPAPATQPGVAPGLLRALGFEAQPRNPRF